MHNFLNVAAFNNQIKLNSDSLIFDHRKKVSSLKLLKVKGVKSIYVTFVC